MSTLIFVRTNGYIAASHLVYPLLDSPAIHIQRAKILPFLVIFNFEIDFPVFIIRRGKAIDSLKILAVCLGYIGNMERLPF